MDPKPQPKRAVLNFTPRLMDLEAAAAYLSMSPSFVRWLIDCGKLPLVSIPGPATDKRPAGEPIRRILMRREDIDAFIDGLQRE